jgi:membrane protein DedA with SNARE-associated domain
VITLPAFPASAGYAGLAGFIAGESAGLPLPGETSLIAAALLASDGRLSLPVVIVVAASAAIVGDNAGYLIGRHGGRRLLARPGRWAERRKRLLVRAEALFARHGGKTVFFARWAPGLRVTAAWAAGTARMRWPRFLFWNALGGIAWATTVGLAGFFLGKAASTILAAVGAAVLAAFILVALVAVGLVLLRRHRRCGTTSSTSS